jgi:hypothetical protein
LNITVKQNLNWNIIKPAYWIFLRYFVLTSLVELEKQWIFE